MPDQPNSDLESRDTDMSDTQPVTYDDEQTIDTSEWSDEKLEAEISDAAAMGDQFQLGLHKAAKVERSRENIEELDGTGPATTTESTTGETAGESLAERIRQAEADGRWGDALRMKSSLTPFVRQ